MPFLVGYFGKEKNRYHAGIAALARQSAQKESLQEIHTDTCYMISGCSQNEISQSETILSSDQSLIIGKIFTRDTYQRVVAFPDEAVSVSQQQNLLTKHCWGRYAGALHDDTKKQITLIRDLTGLNTIFYLQNSDGILFASELSLLYDCLPEKPGLDWNYFTDYIVGNKFAFCATPFIGICELQPGMVLHHEFDGTSTQELVWDVSSMGSSCIANEAEFEEQLLHTLRQCVKASISQEKGICVELSGGLDSSGVMLVLKDVLGDDQKCIAVNYIDSKEPSANEIPYAQEVADAAGTPLHFIDNGSRSLDPVHHDWRPNRPIFFLLFGNDDVQLLHQMNKYGCTQIMNGQGGDHVFLAPAVQSSVADYWLEKGVFGSGNILRQISEQYRAPWLSVLGHNLKAVGRYYTGSVLREKEDVSWLSADYMYAYKKSDHYLQHFTKNFYPAKAHQIQSLSHATHFADRNQRLPNVVFEHPLLAQPIIELGLQVPTYQTFAQGYDRILFRRAVSKIKNVSSLWRKQKGDTTASMFRGIQSNIKRISSLLADGQLVKSGFINSQWLAASLVKVQHGDLEAMNKIVSVLSAQLWLNQWKLY